MVRRPERDSRIGNVAALSASHLSILEGRRVLLTDVEVWELGDNGRFTRVAVDDTVKILVAVLVNGRLQVGR